MQRAGWCESAQSMGLGHDEVRRNGRTMSKCNCAGNDVGVTMMLFSADVNCRKGASVD